MRFQHEGISLWYGTEDAPAPGGSVQEGQPINITIGVTPSDASNKVQLLYRINNGQLEKPLKARFLRTDPSGKIQYFLASFPSEILTRLHPGDLVQFTIGCQCAGRQVPPAENAKQLVSSFNITHEETKIKEIRSLEKRSTALHELPPSIKSSVASNAIFDSGGPTDNKLNVATSEAAVRAVNDTNPTVTTVTNAINERNSKRILEYAKLAELGEDTAKRVADKNLNFDNLSEKTLDSLVKEGLIGDNQKEDLLMVNSLGKLTGDNLSFIKALKTENLKSIADFVTWEKADWQKLITDREIPLPTGETAESYAENITFNIEKTYGSQFLLTRLTDLQKLATKLNPLDTVNDLLKNNDKLIDGKNSASIDWSSIRTTDSEDMKLHLKGLTNFANTYRHLGIIELINDKELNMDQKKSAITSRIQLLDTFYRNNSNVDIRLMNFFDMKNGNINWKDIPADKLPLVRKQLMAYQRMLTISDDTADRTILLGKGYDNAMAITDRTEEEFVKTSGLALGKAKMTYARARERSIKVAHNFETIRNVIRGEFQYLAMSNLSSLLINDLREIDGFEEFFGSQNFCECEECKSILSPAAYFVDLMRFIDHSLSKPIFSTRLDHPLYLKNRRRDLWNLKLNCDNTHTMIPYLTIVNEVLESYLLENAGPPSESDDGPFNIFKKLSQSSEKSSFSLPFNLPLEELRLYLGHFGLSLHDIYKMLRSADEKVWRAKIDLSKEEFGVITTPDAQDVRLRFGDRATLANFEVQDFIRFAGISRQQLDDLIMLRFNPTLRNIIIDKLIVEGELQNFPEILKNLDDNMLDFIHRFIRLWRKTTWSLTELDLVLSALKDAGMVTSELDDDIVLSIAQLIEIQDKLKLKTEELSSLVHSLPVSKDYPEPPVKEGDKQLFERIFDPEKLFGAGNSSLMYHHYRFNRENPNDDTIHPGTPILLGGLGTSETELIQLFELLKNKIEFDSHGDCLLDLHAISLLYRHARLAKTLKFSIDDFIHILSLNFSPPDSIVISLKQIHQLIEFRDWLKSSSFGVPELRLILKGEESTILQYRTNLDVVSSTVLEIQKLQEAERVNDLKARLSVYFNITPNQLESNLRWINTEVNSPQIIAALNAAFTDEGEPANADDLIPLLELMRELERLTLVFTSLGLNEVSISFLTHNLGLLGIADPKHLTVDNIRALTTYKRMITVGENVEPKVQAVLEGYMTNGSFAEAEVIAMGKIWIQDRNLVDSLVMSLNFPNPPIDALEYLRKCLDVCITLGINGFSLKRLADDANNFASLIAARDIALGAFSSKYDDEKIRREKLEPYEEKINIRKRDALCDYILAQHEKLKFKDLNDIYAFFLLDIEMGGCSRTSRLVSAISSLQLYVHRCQVNLEQSSGEFLGSAVSSIKVEPSRIDPEQWEWRKNYRVWEANRKVFLYPENYLEPDLRDNKSPPFKELEEELLQQKITKGSVEAAYRKYVTQFAELARLRIAGSYYHSISDTYYIFGRTQQDPPQYYYRKWIEAKAWTPWQKIEMGINSDRVSAIIHLGRLYLFWVEVKSSSKQTVTNATVTDNYSLTKELMYSFVNEQGNWVPAQKLLLDRFTGLVSDQSAAAGKIVFPLIHNNQIIVLGYDSYLEALRLRGHQLNLFRRESRIVTGSDYDPIPEPILPNSPLLKLEYGWFSDPGQHGFKLKAYRNLFPMHEAVMEHESVSLIPLNTANLTSIINADRFSPRLSLVGSKTGDFVFELADQTYLIKNVEPYHPISILRYVSIENAKFQLATQSIAVAATESSAQENATAMMSPSESRAVGTVKFEASINPSSTVTFSPDLYKSARTGLAREDFGPLQIPKRYAYRISTSLHDKLGEILFTRGLEEFLSLTTQREHELPVGVSFTNWNELVGPYDNPNHIDFKGAYGEYYRELFFHIPFLIANHLNANQKFREAKWWYERIFDPTASESPEDLQSTDRNWRYIEFRGLTIQKMKDILTDEDSIDKYKEDPFNPHAIARLRIDAYQKAIVMKYIDNLLDWGDFLFTQDTVESINEATMLYVLASDILGKRPVKLGKCQTADEDIDYRGIELLAQWESEFLITLESWMSVNDVTVAMSKSKNSEVSDGGSATNNPGVDSMRAANIKTMHKIDNYDVIVDVRNKRAAEIKHIEDAKLDTGEQPSASIARQSTLVFCIPQNKDLLKYWDRVEDRLRKIRNCMNISGVRRQLMLFQPEINPMLLVRARAAGLSLEDILRSILTSPPRYRFTYLIEKAKQFTQTAQSFGSALLSALEKKDVEELSLLRSVHERNILQMTKEIKKQQVKEALNQYKAMLETGTNVQNRINYYQGLIDGGLTNWESIQQISRHVSSVLQVGDGLLRLMAGITYLIPQIGSPFAMKYGGKEIGDSATAFAEVVASSVKIAEAISASAGLEATFQRREQDWKQQLLLAEHELKQVEAQTLAAELRQLIAEKDLEIHEKNMEQANELHEFYKNKFTNLGIYNYLSTTLNRIYREAYNVAFDLSKMAERAYQIERDDDDAIFIAPDNWQFDRAGLLAGERLLLQLQRMEKTYLDKNTRDYEVTQSFSLALWNPKALEELKNSGRCNFAIPEIMLDLFYPGQYNRLIKSVRLTIPSVVGPYTNIGAKLTLEKSYVRREANINSVLQEEENQKLSSIATTNAQNDGGVFELNFRDERYLPFEGAGALSEWILELPARLRTFDYDTISDVIMHISYTAKDDGLFRTEVETNITQTLLDFADSIGLYRLISLKHEFPSALYQLLHPSPGAAHATTEIELKRNHFPYFLIDQDLVLSTGTAYLKAKNTDPIDTSGLALKINNSEVVTWTNFGGNMKEGSVTLSGNPIRKWTISAGTNDLDAEELEDILILMKYKTSS